MDPTINGALFSVINELAKENLTMNKIYKKNEVTFAIICIVIYVVGSSIMESVAESIGIDKLPSMIFHIVYTAVLLIWLKKNDLFERYGLVKPKYKLYKAWFFLPLIIVACSKIFFGMTLKYSLSETIFYFVSMVCVGFLEEIIFRGFLFLGMAKDNIKTAIIVSSITFGIGHIVNLFNGQDTVKTLLQIVFAVAAGFSLVALFYKGKSLIPCIIFHSLNNALSAVSDEKASVRFFGSAENEMFIGIGISVILLVIYSIYLMRTTLVGKDADVE